MSQIARKTAVAAVALAFVLGGCSTKADKGDSGSDGDLKVDYGVTDDTISLGAITDYSGPFKASGLAMTTGNQMWATNVNEAGGICGREIKLDVQDAGYKPDNALTLYSTMRENNVAMLQLHGSPLLAALKQHITNDSMLTIPSAWASVNLDSPSVLVIGQTYDVEAINALAWLQEQGKIADGDTIGHIYSDSEYGQNALLGAEYYAEQHDMTIESTPIQSSDTDMTSTMVKMKEAGVKAILLSTAPAATGSVVLQNVAQQMNVPLMGNNPTFSATLLDDEAMTEALDQFHTVNSVAAFGTPEIPLSMDIATQFESEYDEHPEKSTPTGYIYGVVMGEVLKKACENGDMTRAGIIAAKGELTSVDTEGLTGELDLSHPGSPTTRETFVMEIDPAAPAGLKNVGGLYASEDAKKYKTPHQ